MVLKVGCGQRESRSDGLRISIRILCFFSSPIGAREPRGGLGGQIAAAYRCKQRIVFLQKPIDLADSGAKKCDFRFRFMLIINGFCNSSADPDNPAELA